MGMPNWKKTEIGEASAQPYANRFTWYEFFAGGGMARLGLGPQWECIFANEWCEKKAKAYRERKFCRQGSPRSSDLVWASFPCQA